MEYERVVKYKKKIHVKCKIPETKGVVRTFNNVRRTIYFLDEAPSLYVEMFPF